MRLSLLLQKAKFPHPPLHDCEITSIALDSRNVKDGSLFFALHGACHDGKDFIAQACDKGARAIITTPDGASLVEDVNANIFEVHAPQKYVGPIAYAFYGAQPHTQIAVTGTNGKTSTVDFTCQLARLCAIKAATIGTLGLRGVQAKVRLPSLTTPDSISLAKILATLQRDHVTLVALEASSHGLAQNRLCTAHITAGGFTNFGRDHLDYHRSLHAYLEAKLRLFTHVLPPHGRACISDAVGEEILRKIRRISHRRHLNLRIIGYSETCFIRILHRTPTQDGQYLTLAVKTRGTKEIFLPLIGEFQALNALMALALTFEDAAWIFAHLELLENLKPVPGRLDKVSNKTHTKTVYIDYAHTPDALAHMLKTVRNHCPQRLLVIFGAGGDRDKGKRPHMGRVVAQYADQAFITDDNPRFENPALIRETLQKYCPHAQNIADRQKAIASAIEDMNDGDILVIAGRGHERYQTRRGHQYPLRDKDIARHYLR